METSIRILRGTATRLESLADASIDLVVTSPPYPMIEMWDEVFAAQERELLVPEVAAVREDGEGRLAVSYLNGPQAEFARDWSPAELANWAE